MRETFLGAVTHGATKGTTPTVFEHRRRHLLSAGTMPSPMDAARILGAEPASSHFLADGVAAAVHHAARAITPPQPSCGLLPNTFVERFHKHVAKAQNAHRGRWENFWSSEPPCIVRLEDPMAVLDAIVYTALNPVKDGLVARVREWPGVNGLMALLERKPLRAHRPAHFFREEGPMPESVELELAIPTELGDPEEVRTEIRSRVEAAEARLAAEREAAGRKVVGVWAILRQAWQDSPTSPAARRNRRPRTAARHIASWLLARIRASAFLTSYRSARARWIEGQEAEFPEGTYWLRRFAGVRVSAIQS